MTRKQLFSKLGELRTRNHRRLNDIHIWCSLALLGLARAQNDATVLAQEQFAVPSARPHKTVVRSPEKVRQILSGATRDLYCAVLVYMTAQVEACLGDVMSLVLQFDPSRLKAKVQGIDIPASVERAEAVDGEPQDFVKSAAERQLTVVFYARPSLQFDYLRRVIGVEVKPNLRSAWIELKATRDLVVHNAGLINEIYLRKCGSLARGKFGDQIVIDQDYFERCVATAKSLIGTVSSQLQTAFK